MGRVDTRAERLASRKRRKRQVLFMTTGSRSLSEGGESTPPKWKTQGMKTKKPKRLAWAVKTLNLC